VTLTHHECCHETSVSRLEESGCEQDYGDRDNLKGCVKYYECDFSCSCTCRHVTKKILMVPTQYKFNSSATQYKFTIPQHVSRKGGKMQINMRKQTSNWRSKCKLQFGWYPVNSIDKKVGRAKFLDFLRSDTIWTDVKLEVFLWSVSSIWPNTLSSNCCASRCLASTVNWPSIPNRWYSELLYNDEWKF